MSKILLIAPITPVSTAATTSAGEMTGQGGNTGLLASALASSENDVAILAPRARRRLRGAVGALGAGPSRGSGGTSRRSSTQRSGPPGSIPTWSIDLPWSGRALPGALDAALFRRLPAALRRAGLERPQALLVTAVDASVIVARALSVLYGMPYVLVVDTEEQLPAGREDRYEQLLAQSVQEAAVVAATTPEHAQELKERFTPSAGVHVVPSGDPRDFAATASALCARALDLSRGGRMVFHAPYPLDAAPRSASRQRPNKMLAAFEETGREVHRITGYPFQRALGLRDLRRRFAAGQRIDFLYSENSTQPNVFSTSLRRGVAPFLEARILASCGRRGIPVGQFYRDVYWRFPESQAGVPPLRRALMQIAYRADLRILRRSHARVFLPSAQMAPILPFDPDRCTALPPGAPIHDSISPDGLHLLYVGGIGPGYAIDEALTALRDSSGATLTMVVRENEWEAHRERYESLLTDRVRIVHAGADELQEHYDAASACLLLVAPDGYRRFAVPLKLFEYVGFGKPVLASEGTLAAQRVAQMGCGFTVENDHIAIAALLDRLARDPSLIERAAGRARAARRENTWAMRARTVADVLTGSGPQTGCRGA